MEAIYDKSGREIDAPEGMTIIARIGNFVATEWQHGPSTHTTHEITYSGLAGGHYFTSEADALADLKLRSEL